MDLLTEEDLKQAAVYSCKFDQPPANEDKYGKKLLLIRHALSEFNYQYEKLFIENPNLQRTDPSLDELRNGLQALDTPLHKLGEKQCMSNQEQICKIDTELVLVSPLHRTLQTALILFQKHPNRKNIRFLLFPWVAESLNASCCISNQIYGETRKKFIEEAAQYDIKLDFSILDNQLLFPSQLKWQLEIMEDGDVHRQQAQNVKGELEYAQHLSNEMKRMYPSFYENWSQLIKRSDTLKIKLKEIIQQQEKTVTVVSHCNILKCLTREGVDEKGWVYGIHIYNCGMTYYSLD